MTQFAWVVAHVMNASGNMKRRVTIERLLGRPQDSGKNMSPIVLKKTPPRNWDEMRDQFYEVKSELIEKFGVSWQQPEKKKTSR